jgi:hypothetical protein
MRAAFSQFFTTITLFFSVVYKFVKAADHIAGIAESGAAGYAKEIELEQQAKLAKLISANKVTAVK